MQITWNREMKPEQIFEILNQKSGENADIHFPQTVVFSSAEIAKLLLIAKKCASENRPLTLITYKKTAYEVLFDMGLAKVGANILLSK